MPKNFQIVLLKKKLILISEAFCFSISFFLFHDILVKHFLKNIFIKNSIKPATHFFSVHVQLVSFSIVWYSLITWECGSHLGFFSLLHMGLHIVTVSPLWKSHRHISWQFGVVMDWFIPKVRLSYRHCFTGRK